MNSQSPIGNVHAGITRRTYEVMHCRDGHPWEDLDDWVVVEQEMLAKAEIIIAREICSSVEWQEFPFAHLLRLF